ncbi:MAG TPA: glutathione binding-like protein, partial [Myxococcales bacterium]
TYNIDLRLSALVPGFIEKALAESNAILLYLARGTRLLPEDVRTQALVQQWMFFEQNQVESSIGIPRFLRKQGKDPDAVGEHYLPRAKAALKVLEQHLLMRHWLVGEAYSVADVAMFAYSHMAPDAGHDLSHYPALSAWMARVRAQPGWFGLE